MGTVQERVRSGGVVFTARVRRRRKGQGMVSESQTFATRAEAEGWCAVRDGEISRTPDLALIQRASPSRNPPVREVIDRYLAKKADLADSKRHILRRIRDFRIGAVRCADLRAGEIVDFASDKAAEGVQPATVNRYLAELSATLSFARIYWGCLVDMQVMSDAWTMATKLGIAGKSHRRDRRPTLKELNRILKLFHARTEARPTAVPMAKIIAFAIFSTRRRGEICRIRWDDLDRKAHQVIVRDMKNPGNRVGNNVVCDLPRPAAAIAASMPRRAARIFPYEPDTISALWRDACRQAHVHNLHFHDLRHEGISRLFEMGWNTPRVLNVSGHRSMANLQRYTHIVELGDKFADWEWTKSVIEPHWVADGRRRRAA